MVIDIVFRPFNAIPSQPQHNEHSVTSTKQIEIVPIALNHVEGFHRALDSVARERKYLSIFEAFSVRAMTDFVVHQNKTGGPAFVAHREGEVIGWCDIRRQTLPAFAHRGSVGMGVVAEWRGRGIGFRLLDAALDAAFRQGFARVELEVRTDNARAIALYDKIGFVREGLLRDSFFINGEYFDAIAMAIIRRPQVCPAVTPSP
jgi:RimJ/RimL family protein N-acetyltransferase